MAVKVNNVYIRENASSQYQQVSNVFANGNKVYGMSVYPTGSLYIKYNGQDTSNYYYSIESDEVWASGQELTIVGYASSVLPSNPYESMGSNATRGTAIMNSSTCNLSIPKTSTSQYVGIGISTTLKVNDLKVSSNLTDSNPRPDGETISQEQGTYWALNVDDTKAYLTNLPYGATTIMGTNDYVWLIYQGIYNFSGSRLSLGDTNWHIKQSKFFVTNA